MAVVLDTYKATQIFEAYKGYSPTAGDISCILVNCWGQIVFDNPEHEQKYSWQDIGKLEDDGTFKITAGGGTSQEKGDTNE